MYFGDIWNTLLSLFLPARCVGCNRSGVYLCDSCLRTLPPPLDLSDTTTFSLFEYSDPRVKKLVWHLKYHGHTALAQTLGKLMHQELLNTLADWQSYHPGTTEKWLVIPIPLSRKRQRRRGYNQSEKLAQTLVKQNLPILELETKALLKIKETPTQVSIRDRTRRLQNLRGAFAISTPERVHGRRIIVVDDVTTTGATMAETRRVLKTAGARAVLGITIAHG